MARKIDPKYVNVTRELRDRYLERLNTASPPPPPSLGKYDVSRLPAPPERKPVALLKAA